WRSWGLGWQSVLRELAQAGAVPEPYLHHAAAPRTAAVRGTLFSARPDIHCSNSGGVRPTRVVPSVIRIAHTNEVLRT
ncbi:hypothetical protein ACWD4T_42920, partial [Streptomyces umbrinus]